MTQQFQILKCFKCSTFQVHQVKKSIIWQCKMCEEKQSVKRNYGVGSGKECRLHVQKLNSLRGIIKYDDGSNETNEDIVPFIDDIHSVKGPEQPTSSKWLQYVEDTNEPEAVTVNDENITFNGAEVVLELPKNKRKRNKAASMLSESRQDTSDREKPNATITVSKNVPVSNIHSFQVNPSKKMNSEHIYVSKTDPAMSKLQANLYHEPIKFDKTKPDKDAKIPRVFKCSKWAQYVEDSGEDDSEGEKFHDEHIFDSLDIIKSIDMRSAPVSKELFSQCSDEDIDHLLNL